VVDVARSPAVKAAYAVAIAITVITFAVIWQSTILGKATDQVELGRDYATFHGAALLVAEANPAAMYQPDELGPRIAEATGYEGVKTQPYGHPPFFPLYLITLTPLPFLLAYMVFLVGGVVALGYAVRRVGLRRATPVLALTALSLPGYWTIQLGQMGFWVAALLLAIYLAIRRGRLLVAGLLLGLLAFKPLYAVGIGIWWLLRFRRYAAAVLGALCSVGALVVAGYAVPEGWASYRALVSESGDSFVSDVATTGFSLFEMWLALIPSSVVVLALWLAVCVAVLAGFWRLLEVLENRLEPAFAMAVVVGLLISPRTGWYDWMLLVVPAVLVWHTYPRLRPSSIVAGAWLFLAGACSWMLAGAMEDSIGPFLQIAPIILTATAWWWFRSAASVESSPSPAA